MIARDLAQDAKTLRLSVGTLRTYISQGVGCHRTAERISLVTGIPLKELLYGRKAVRTEVADGSPTPAQTDGNPKRQ